MTKPSTIILTALDLEYEAVKAHLTGVETHRHRAGTLFETGRIGGCRVVLGLVGTGNQAAAVITERAITEFEPSAVLFVGVAGALWPHIELGDVVVANRAYAYHGLTSEDDGDKARPRAWQTSHWAEQIAHHLVRGNAWTKYLAPGAEIPKVHFGPIAAGEVVQDSAISAHAKWVRQTYNDAKAIEMEAAGVSEAAHLNGSLPVVVIRGISDRADGTKVTSDGAGWQQRAVTNAAALAAALTEEMSKEIKPRNDPRKAAGKPMNERVTNIARGNARVGVMAGAIHGDVNLNQAPEEREDPEVLLAELRRRLGAARRDGVVDEATYSHAGQEIDTAADSLAEGTSEGKSTALIALKKVNGLLMDVADLAARVVAIIAAIKGLG
ncbi:5'-methylthioadenosine/S-adenosylhomocysteine nucleosidase family protein [Herbidospora daliensis]|uniref:5'-methylthioadenosine/S-adenosylhomocysteine nucleosidase family protein n=1 Tax=Herbidospora daliensis TaxID=295585 RepID=UPI000780C107|nr:5'-methylthioadenosine/S-adenosylhomocysteine nucleosidase [Herbidospora daliensis]